jgi:molecular chaperone DnaK
MDKSRLVFGIDLGTTYSCVAHVDEHDKATVLANFDSKTTTPSVIYFGEGEDPTVGDVAKDMAAVFPERTVSFIKRHIGVDESFKKPTPFPNGLDPVEISALILKKLVKDANNALSLPEPVKSVVITCPAYFGTKERMQTKQAGEAAGLDVLSIINEPTAAAIAYGLKATEPKVILVYDLGGGTFDATIIRVDSGTITVVATGGDHKLGGKDWDEIIAGYLLLKYNEEHGANLALSSDPGLTNALMLEAENKKQKLSQLPKINVVCEYQGKTTRVELTRETFDALTEGNLEETIDKTKEVLEIASKQGFTKIDEVLLVGGSSKMPQVKARLVSELNALGINCEPKLTDPDQCVAKGAAIFALNKSIQLAVEAWNEDATGDVPKPKKLDAATAVNLKNVTSKTYGTDVYQDGVLKVRNLIFANKALPEKFVERFITGKDNQLLVPMKVYESNVTDPDKDRTIDPRSALLLEDRDLQLTSNHPKGTPVSVTFEIDVEGILSVHAQVGADVLEFKLRITGLRDDHEMAQTVKLIAGTNVQ